MKRLFIFLIILFFLGTLKVNGYSPPLPFTYAVKSPDGLFILVMKPTGVEGKGTVYKREYYRKGEPLWSFNWYSQHVELANTGEHVIRFTPSKDAKHNLAFYHKDKLVKKYRSWDLLNNKDAYYPCSWAPGYLYSESPSVRDGFSDDGLRYTVVMADKTVYEFDVKTGVITRSYVDLASMTCDEIREFGERKRDERIAAIDALMKEGKSAVPNLLELMNEKDGYYRMVAARALGEIGPDAQIAIPVLIKALQDESRNIRKEASYALGRIGKPAVPALIKILDNADKTKVSTLLAIKALGNVGRDAKHAVPLIIRELAGDDDELGVAAVIALGNIGPDAKEALPALIEELKPDYQYVQELFLPVFVKIGKPAIPALINVLKDKDQDPNIRRAVAMVLGGLGPEAQEAVPILIMELKYDASSMHIEASEALSKIGKSTVPALIKVLKDKNQDEDIREAAAETIGDIGPEANKAVSTLITAMKNEQHDLRRKASEALAKIGEPAVPALIKVLKDKNQDSFVRSYAISALGGIGPKAQEAVPSLIAALKDEDKRFRSEAIDALGKIGPGAKKAVLYLIEALKEERSYYRDSAIKALGAIGPDAKQAVPFIIGAYREEEYASFAAEAIWAATAIWKIGPNSKDAIGFLGKVSKINETNIAEFLAGDAEIGTPDVSVLIQFLKNKNEDIDARRVAASILGIIGSDAKEAVTALIKALGEEDMELRKRAAYALGEIGFDAEAAVSVLMAMSKNEDNEEEVRWQAYLALMNIVPGFEGDDMNDYNISVCTIAIEINSKDFDAYIERGKAWEKKGDYERACSDWKRACELGTCEGLNSGKANGICN